MFTHPFAPQPHNQFHGPFHGHPHSQFPNQYPAPLQSQPPFHAMHSWSPAWSNAFGPTHAYNPYFPSPFHGGFQTPFQAPFPAFPGAYFPAPAWNPWAFSTAFNHFVPYAAFAPFTPLHPSAYPSSSFAFTSNQPAPAQNSWNDNDWDSWDDWDEPYQDNAPFTGFAPHPGAYTPNFNPGFNGGFGPNFNSGFNQAA